MGVTTTLNFDKPLIGFPYVLSYPIASVTLTEHVGFTDAGMLHVMVFVAVPIVAPDVWLYVVSVNTMETEVPVVFWLASEIGGVKDTLVLVVFVAIVPDALPHL